MKLLRRLATKWQHESGQNLVQVALWMVVILGMTALVLDGGYAFAQRRRMQNAADAGALAGARELGLGGDDSAVYARIDEYTRVRNGASSFEATYYPGGELIGMGIVPDGATGVRVTAGVTFPTFFAGVIGFDQLTARASAVATYEAVATGGPALCPIAIEQSFFTNCPEGEASNCPEGQIFDIWAGGGPGNFGWLGWDGSTDTPSVCVNLWACVRGEEGYPYINPDFPGDSDGVSPYDWVEGTTAVKNALCVRQALDELIRLAYAESRAITIVVWDQSELNGANLNYRVMGFAKFKLTSYRLPNENVIWGTFAGWVDAVTVTGGGDYHLYGVKLVE